MNRMDEFDALRKQDWSKVYADVPEAVNEGVEIAFARIRAHERRKKYSMRILACAASLAVVLGVGSLVLAGGGSRQPDMVAAPVAQLRILSNDAAVYAARADDYFHIDSGCRASMAEQVELQLVTALEFEKQLCPVCGAKVRLPE